MNPTHPICPTLAIARSPARLHRPAPTLFVPNIPSIESPPRRPVGPVPVLVGILDIAHILTALVPWIIGATLLAFHLRPEAHSLLLIMGALTGLWVLCSLTCRITGLWVALYKSTFSPRSRLVTTTLTVLGPTSVALLLWLVVGRATILGCLRNPRISSRAHPDHQHRLASA